MTTSVCRCQSHRPLVGFQGAEPALNVEEPAAAGQYPKDTLERILPRIQPGEDPSTAFTWPPSVTYCAIRYKYSNIDDINLGWQKGLSTSFLANDWYLRVSSCCCY